jgi:hypothetical protein
MVLAMDKHHRDLACRLFTTATEILEDTHLVTTGGQSPRRNVSDQIKRARALKQAADDLKALADAISAVIRRS